MASQPASRTNGHLVQQHERCLRELLDERLQEAPGSLPAGRGRRRRSPRAAGRATARPRWPRARPRAAGRGGFASSRRVCPASACTAAATSGAPTSSPVGRPRSSSAPRSVLAGPRHRLADVCAQLGQGQLEGERSSATRSSHITGRAVARERPAVPAHRLAGRLVAVVDEEDCRSRSRAAARPRTRRTRQPAGARARPPLPARSRGGRRARIARRYMSEVAKTATGSGRGSRSAARGTRRAWVARGGSRARDGRRVLPRSVPQKVTRRPGCLASRLVGRPLRAPHREPFGEAAGGGRLRPDGAVVPAPEEPDEANLRLLGPAEDAVGVHHRADCGTVRRRAASSPV